MSSLKQLGQEALNLLPVREQERLVLSMWDSLEGTLDIDPEGVVVAKARDADIALGSVTAISHAEFRRRTGGHG